VFVSFAVAIVVIIIVVVVLVAVVAVFVVFVVVVVAVIYIHQFVTLKVSITVVAFTYVHFPINMNFGQLLELFGYSCAALHCVVSHRIASHRGVVSLCYVVEILFHQTWKLD
jgi:hypothetical protein